jgi:hypothetical protein
MDPFAPQEGHCLHAIRSHVQTDVSIRVAESFLRQPDVAGTVFHQ